MDVRLVSIIYVGWITSRFILVVILICTPALWSGSLIPDYCLVALLLGPIMHCPTYCPIVFYLLSCYFIVSDTYGLSYCITRYCSYLVVDYL